MESPNLRRGDTKGSCVTGDAGDHSVRKPTCDRALFCWHQALGLSIWTSCASKSPLWQNEGKISVQPKHGEAPTFLCFTRLLAKVKVTWQMDVEKSESQVEWWWWWWGWWRWCWWWDTAKGLLREETHKACDESSLGGGGAWNWTFRAERRYLDPKREHPTMSMVAHHLVHLNSHLEVYIVRHTHRAGEKKHDQC